MGLDVETGETADDQVAPVDEQAIPDGEVPEGSGAGETPPDDEEVVVSIGDDVVDPEQEQERTAPQWVRDLRKTTREQAKRIRELEEERKAAMQPAKAASLGPRPTLEACEYDEERFDRELEGWLERKREADAKAREEEKAAEAQKKAFQDRLDAYEAGKKTLKVSDFSEAEEAIRASFSVTQQGVIVAAAKKPELIVYALGKNDKERAAFAAIQDPVKFAYALGELETKLKVMPRKSVPPPERRVSGSAPGLASDSQLAKLEAEADRTGDRSKVIAWKRQQKLKQAT